MKRRGDHIFIGPQANELHEEEEGWRKPTPSGNTIAARSIEFPPAEPIRELP